MKETRVKLVYIPCMFDLLTTDAIDLLRRDQRVIHKNVVSSKSMDVVF
jgi:hypothetical protein